MICPYCTSGITKELEDDKHACKSCGKAFYAPNESLVTEEPCMDIEPGKIFKIRGD